MKIATMTGALLAVAVMAMQPVMASSLVYTPLNPSFGGNPSNGIVMLNEAQAQDQTKPPSHSSASAGGSSSGTGSSSGSGTTKCLDTKLCQFENALQSAILSRLSSDIVSNLIKPDGSLNPGTIDTVNFTIDVIDLGGQKVQVTTTSKSTGQTETFVIDQGVPPI